MSEERLSDKKLERHLSGEDILEHSGYQTVGEKVKKSSFGSFFSKIWKSIKESASYKAVSNSFIGKGFAAIGGATKKVLNHPGGRLATFGLAVTIGVIGIVGTGGAALIFPAVGLGAVVAGKTVSVGIDAHRENKIRSLGHQLELLRTLEDAEHQHTKNLDRIVDSSKQKPFEKIKGSMRSMSAEYIAAAGEEHQRNLPTARGEAIKSAVKGMLTIASAAVDLSSLPVSAVGAAQHAPDLVSKSLDIREAGEIGAEVQEQLEGSKKEAVLKARVNMLTKKLKVPRVKNTEEMANHVRTRLSLMQAKEAVYQEHANREGGLSREGAIMYYSHYKGVADKDESLDAKVAKQRERGSYVKRMASSVSRALLGEKKDWKFFKKSNSKPAPEVPDARRESRGSISR